MSEVTVSRLTRRLADTPPDFLDPAAVSVPAVVSDVLLMSGGSPLTEAGTFTGDPRRLTLVLITSWLLADPELQPSPDRALALLTSDLDKLALLVPPARFVTDPDRREELARLTLHALGITPAGETAAQASDRLSTVDSVRRHEVLLAAKAAEERAQAVRKAMEEQAAREAASRYSQV
jgi:hypothetical protein